MKIPNPLRYLSPAQPGIAVLLILITLNIQPASAQPGFDFRGSVTRDTIWDADTVRIHSNVKILDSATLTIAPGTRVEFWDYYDLVVAGCLVAEGAYNDSILFTMMDTTEFYLDSVRWGGWGGILFDNGFFGEMGNMSDNDTSRISHCIIEYAKGIRDYGDVARFESGGILVEKFSNLVVEHSQIRYCKSTSTGGGIHLTQYSSPVIRYNYIHHNEAPKGGGIGVNNSSPLIHHNIISRNSDGGASPGWGAGIYMAYSEAILKHNEISYNSNRQRGGGIKIYGGDCMIRNNEIHHNQAPYGGGMDIDLRSAPTVRNNRFYLNTADFGAAMYNNVATTGIISNLFYNNESQFNGGAIYTNASDPLLLNNTIANNRANRGGGVYTRLSNPLIVNNILWGNTAVNQGPQFGFMDNLLNPVMDKNIIQGGSAAFYLEYGGPFAGDYGENWDLDPQFLNPVPGSGITFIPPDHDWGLMKSSPSMNAGTHEGFDDIIPAADPEGNPRVLYGTIDLGALEKQIPSVTAGGLVSTYTHLMADTVFITNDITVLDNVTLEIAVGSMIRFLGPYYIDVQGTIRAIGGAGNPILFTMHDTTGFSSTGIPGGGWQGILFNNSQNGMNGDMHDNEPSVLDHCILEYVKTEQGEVRAPVTLLFFNGLTLSNCTIRNNICHAGAGAVFSEFSKVHITDNLIENNHALHVPPYNSAGALNMNLSEGIIWRNTILNNHSDMNAGGLHSYSSKLSIRYNTFAYNTAASVGAAINAYLSNDTLVNNIISNNNADDFNTLRINSSKYLLVGNLFCNNDMGPAAYFSDLTLVNNTIVNNGNYGVFFSNGDFTMLNTIVTGNQEQVYIHNEFKETRVSNCLVEGGMAGVTGIWNGSVSNILGGEPDFRDPSDSLGEDFGGLEADFSLLSFSPCINAALADLPVELPASDLLGQSRVHGSFPDIGAIENQDVAPVITSHPFGGYYCEGDTLDLYALAADTAIYQWFHGITPLVGMQHSTLTLAGLTAGDEGNYYCRISNAYDTLETVPAFININAAPVIDDDPVSSYTTETANSSLSVYSSGEDLQYQWYHDGNAIQGASLPIYRYTLGDSSREGLYSCVVSNVCGADTSAPAAIWLAPQVCMVTVSSTTGNNLVVWEKNSKAPTTAYNLYRESVAAGIYDLLATIPSDALSVFVDTSADPTVQAYLYKITAIDTGNMETDIDLCKPHKTIHLIVSTNPELKTTQLQWDRYFGFDYQTYTIYKSTTGFNFDPVHSMSASLNSWTDPVALASDQFYRIAVQKPDPCVPEGSGKKAGTGPYVNSLSNMDDNKLKAGQLPPDTITISNDTIAEGRDPGAVVGKLFTVDGDSLDAHNYKFVPGEGDADNLHFSISGDLLLASGTFDYETRSSYTIRIRSTDEQGNYCEVPFTIHISDVDETVGLRPAGYNALSIYPNPMKGSALIRFPDAAQEPYRLRILDISGKVCFMEEGITASPYLLKRNGLEPGVYLLELTGPEKHLIRLMVE